MADCCINRWRSPAGDNHLGPPKAPRVVRTPSGAEVPRQPTGEQIQLTQVQTVPSPVGDSLYLNAMLHNAGNSAITGAQVNAQFVGANGAIAGSTTGTVQAVFGGTSSEDLTKAPIKPNESRPVRIYSNTHRKDGIIRCQH